MSRRYKKVALPVAKLGIMQYAACIQRIKKLEVIDAEVINRSDHKVWLAKNSISFKANGFNAIMAASGVGKTMLLDLMRSKINGVNTKVSGRVEVTMGDDTKQTYEANDRAKRLTCGFVPQDDIVFDDLTVEENLLYSALLRLPHKRDVVAEIVSDVIDRLGLDSIRHVIVGNTENRSISGGQRKRVNIGLEVVSLPSLLIMDEPTSGLDAKASFDIISICKMLTQRTGMTIITVLHQPRFNAYMLFDRVVLLNKMGTVYAGDPSMSVAYFIEFCKFDFDGSDDNPADIVIDLIADSKLVDVWNVSGRDWLAKHVEAHPRLHDLVQSYPHTNSITARIKQAYSDTYLEEIQCIFEVHETSYGQRRFTSISNICTIMQRRSLSLYRSAWWIQLLVPWVAASIIGLIQGPVWDLSQFSSNIALANVALAVLTKVTAISTFSINKPLMWRDTENHVSLLQHFIAYNLVDIIWILLIPFCFFIPYYHFTIPQASFAVFYSVGLALSWWTSGMAYLVSSLKLESKWAMLVGVFISVIFGAFLQGLHPTVASSRREFLQYVLNFSYNRWLIEVLAAKEYEYEQDNQPNVVYGLMDHFGWCGVDTATYTIHDVLNGDIVRKTCDNYVSSAFAWMLGLGLFYRILSFFVFLEFKTKFIEFYIHKIKKKTISCMTRA